MPHKKRSHGHKRPRAKSEGLVPGGDQQTVASGSQSQAKQVTSTTEASAKPAQYEDKNVSSKPGVTPVPPGPSKAVPKTTTAQSPQNPPETTKTTPITASQSQPVKKDTAGVKVSGDVKGQDTKPKDTKVQTEVAPPKAKTSKPAADVDPFDALAGSLPTENVVATLPVYTGPEVKESGIVSTKSVICGDRDDTLPPGYRHEDLEKKSAAAKPEPVPQDVPKPLSTDEALDSLSAGFLSSAPAAPKTETKPAPTTSPAVSKSAAQTKEEQKPAISAQPVYKPATQVKEEQKPVVSASATVSKSSAPPAAEQKAKVDTKVEKKAEVSATAPVTKSAGPPAEKKSKVEKGDSVSLDALEALGDTLGSAEPVPEPPKVPPECEVKENKSKSEKGVRVGEREDSLAPEHRFKDKNGKHPPPPKKEPSLDPLEALDILSGDFTSSSAAPAVHTLPKGATPSATAGKSTAQDLSAMDSLAGDFVAPSQTTKISSSAPPATKSNEGASMSLDALEALGDSLGSAEPVPEAPKVLPKDMVKEEKLTSKKGVRVGEREDSLPPEFRFKDKDNKHPPPPKKEPSLDPSEALDILSGDFTSSSAAPVVQATPKVATPSAPVKQAPAGDVVSAAAAPAAVKSAPPAKAERQVSQGTSAALDALSDTLADKSPAPAPAPVPTKDLVKEKEAHEEKLVKTGERDDTLPEKFRPTEKDLKAAAQAKAKPPKQPSMDDSTALDLLSSDFSSSPAAPNTNTATTAGPAAQAPDARPKEDKSKAKTEKTKAKKSTPDDPSEQDTKTPSLAKPPSSDMVSTKQGGKS
ncbi:calpastatin isoform X4 [Denticeps clupeoides]|uniref:calpastatin isoform X4 n=1 Tax=Denticeps clupeoides TaxID=299321 RepID=UPI0010A3608A|nr:calpastatin isoform X4 [Denticeps clupeoides]